MQKKHFHCFRMNISDDRAVKESDFGVLDSGLIPIRKTNLKLKYSQLPCLTHSIKGQCEVQASNFIC